MKSNRRRFLKSAGLAGIACAAATGPNAQAGASLEEPKRPAAEGDRIPHGLTLLSLKSEHGETLGVKTEKGILDVRATALAMHRRVPLTLDEMLQEGGAGALEKLVAEVQSAKMSRAVYRDESAITFGRLFRNPGKIVCIGLNYREHAKEAGEQVPRVPILFNKYNNALAAHQCTLKLPTHVATKFDHEVELLVVMGRRAHNVSEADALSYVAGYCTSNDFSARDLQLELDGKQWMIGKTLDDFGPIGPYFVSADVVGDPGNMNIECRVNGKTHQSSNTSNMVYNVPYLIAYISKHFPLEAGDLIFTGTPPGVIAGMPREKQEWLKAGDEVACSVGSLGELRFRLA